MEKFGLDGGRIERMQRALKEFRVRGVETNLVFLQRLLAHADFLRGDYNTRFIDGAPELLAAPPPSTRMARGWA